MKKERTVGQCKTKAIVLGNIALRRVVSSSLMVKSSVSVKNCSFALIIDQNESLLRYL